jgi:hypothetical protein
MSTLEELMEGTKRRRKKIVIRLLVTTTLAIIAIGAPVALAAIFHFQG